MKIAIIGTRGIPASYSGFETSVQETAVRFAKNGYDISVYCRSNHYKEKLDSYQSVKLIYLPSLKTKFFDTVSHTLLSIFSAAIKRYDAIILYGVGNSIFIPLLKLFGFPVISVVDGADWERAKWGKFAKWFLRFNRWFSVRFSDYYVVDNELLAKRYEEEFHKKPVYIPYGANKKSVPEREILEKLGLKEKEYIIFIGRFVKEKGIEFLIENFKKTNSGMKLVIVGGNDVDKEYENSLRALGNEEVIFAGFLYGPDYEYLLSKSLFYVSCSFLEGTSPSLLSAMSLNGFALVSDLDENLETLKGSCCTFKTGNSQDFIEKANYLFNHKEMIEAEHIKTQKVVDTYYDWDKITNKYIDLLNTFEKK
jgi:glycosyltransferase involved in cell wall biosynthesis